MLIKTTKFYTLLLGIGAMSFLQAQIQNPKYIVRGVPNPSDDVILTALKGPKVTLSNPTLNSGDRVNQIMTFSGGLAAGLQMDTGVLFTTGWVSEVFSANNSIGELNNGPNVRYDDPDLQKIPGNEEVHTDVVAYEFDVTIPNTATAINVAYQFGSEEYSVYVGSKYNDAFAFFVSGPGIDENTKGNINGKINMARIEHNGVNVPTSINTINQGIYGPDEDNRRDIDPNVVTDYYINNGHNEEFNIRNGKKYYTKAGPDGYGYYTMDFDASQVKVHTAFNGITKKIDYALKGLVPGATYRFKIIIGDAFDGSMDSGVFVEAISAFADIEARNNNYTIDAGNTSTTSVLENDIYKGDFGTITVDNTQVQVKEKTLPRDLITVSTPFNIVKVEADGTRTNSSGFTLDNDGKVIVNDSVTSGTYEFDYKICDAAASDFCSTAKVTVVIPGNTTPSQEQKCYKPGNFTGQGEPTKVGISTIGQPTPDWPLDVPSAHMIMDSNEKGFAINQVANVSTIAEPLEGMIVYDLTEQCVKLYNGSIWKCLERNCN